MAKKLRKCKTEMLKRLEENNKYTVTIDPRKEAQEKLAEMDKMDVQSAVNALQAFLESPDWKRYGCTLVPEGTFVGNQAKTTIGVRKVR